jgi:hypothetical protein
MRWKSLSHPLLHQTPHLLNCRSVSDGFQRHFIESPCDAAKVAGFKAKVPSEMRPDARDRVVERAKHAEISRPANRNIFVLAKSPIDVPFGEPHRAQRLSQHAEKERNHLAIIRLPDADGQTHEQRRLVGQYDALAAFNGEDVALPVAKRRRSSVVG